MVTDPVCKMTIEEKDAVGTSVYKGTTYYFCSAVCKEEFDKNPEGFLAEKAIVLPMVSAGVTGMAKDPICGMVIPKERSIKRETGGRAYYFCSENCVRTFEAPEPELKSMKRRVTIASHGVKVSFDGKEMLIGNMRLMKEKGVSIEGKEGVISGLVEKGNTVMIVAEDNKLKGFIAVADTLKEHAEDVVKDLKAEGIQVVMLTGDNERTARAIGEKLGIERIIANVLPGDKAKVIKELQAEGKVVAMVGDGINDAPALAQSDIGIAIGSGSDVAKETGGIILVKDDLRDVIKSIRLSRATMRKIKQNLFWAFFYNTVAIPIAAFGLLNPIIAAAAMAISSLSVVSNSALLRTVKI